MMKLLLAVIATCALVVSPTCIKIKHQLRSNAPTIHVLISNGNTQMTSQVGRNGSHRFITDNLSSMTLAPAGSQTITLSYDEIFPITNATVCTEVHPVSAGGCADGVCCKVSISMYTITDAIIMTARVNNRKADGNPQFWRCEQKIQVPGITNTELSPEELVTDILGYEHPGSSCTLTGFECGFQPTTHLECVSDNGANVCACDSTSTEDGNECACATTDYEADGHVCRAICDPGLTCDSGNADCTPISDDQTIDNRKWCVCKRNYVSRDGGVHCVVNSGCTVGNDMCSESGTTGACSSSYYGDGFNCHAKKAAGETCTAHIQCQGSLQCNLRVSTPTCFSP